MNKPSYVPEAPWCASRRLRRAWQESTTRFDQNAIRNLDRMFSDAADGTTPAGSKGHCTDFAAQLEQTWKRLAAALRAGDWGAVLDRIPESSAWAPPTIDEQWAVLLNLFATLPESIDPQMKDSLAETRRLRDNIVESAEKLAALWADLREICEARGISYPSVRDCVDGWLACERLRVVHRDVPSKDDILPDLSEFLDYYLAHAVRVWEPAPPEGHEYANIGAGDATDASAMVRHFDARLSRMLGTSLPPNFEVGNTDLARIINALLRRHAITPQGVIKAGKPLNAPE